MRPKRIDLIDAVDPSDTSRAVLRGIRIGAAWTFGFKLYTAPSVVENLTGKLFTFQVRSARDDASVLVSASSEDGQIANGGVTGLLSVVLTPAVTSRIRGAGQGWYALAETTDGMNDLRIEGLIDIVRSVTR